MGYRSRLGKEVNVAGMGTMGIWATSSCNLLAPSRPAGTLVLEAKRGGGHGS